MSQACIAIKPERIIRKGGETVKKFLCVILIVLAVSVFAGCNTVNPPVASPTNTVNTTYATSNPNNINPNYGVRNNYGLPGYGYNNGINNRGTGFGNNYGTNGSMTGANTR